MSAVVDQFKCVTDEITTGRLVARGLFLQEQVAACRVDRDIDIQRWSGIQGKVIGIRGLCIQCKRCLWQPLQLCNATVRGGRVGGGADLDAIVARGHERKSIAAGREAVDRAVAVGRGAATDDAGRKGADAVITQYLCRLSGADVEDAYGCAIDGIAADAVKHNPERVDQRLAVCRIGIVECIGVTCTDLALLGDCQLAVERCRCRCNGLDKADEHTGVDPGLEE